LKIPEPLFFLALGILIILAFALISNSSSKSQNIIRVPKEADSIADALSQATENSIIEVDAKSGPYDESLEIMIAGIQLVSVNGKAQINASQSARQAIKITSDRAQIEGFEISGGGTGILVENASEISIQGNTIKQNGAMGIMFFDVQASSILNNNVSNNFHGIWLSGSSENNTIKKNIIRENAGAGLTLSGSHNIVITENEISHNRLVGIELIGGKANQIEKNSIIGNTNGGIFLDEGTTEHRFAANEIAENGIGIWVLNGFDNVFQGNRIENNSEVGVILESSGKIQLMENLIKGNVVGVRFAAVSGTDIHDNAIEENEFGILVLGQSRDIAITMNNIVGNKEYGLSNEGVQVVTAVENFWGDSSGPAVNENGSKGDILIGSVSFQPWLEAQVELKE
jgi:parallel beta-helix repeat protein